MTTATWGYACGLANGASSKINVNGTETTFNTGTNGLASITVGARATTRALKLDGKLGRLTFWDSDVFDDAVTCAADATCFYDTP